jgi:TrmH family RNA methyltransferase
MEKAAKAQIAFLRELIREKKVRDDEKLFVVEGLKSLTDIAFKGHAVKEVFVPGEPETGREKVLLSELEAKNIRFFSVPIDELEKISSLRAPDGIVAIVNKPAAGDLKKISGGKFMAVLCDGIQDPGNMGTIIRSSVAFGADAVLLLGENVDIYNPKVVRASSGMILDIPVIEISIKDVARLKDNGAVVFAGDSDPELSVPLSDIRTVPDKCIMAFGSEGRGLSEGIRSAADKLFTIPMERRAESLNVSVAVSIALYDLYNKRRKA